MLGSPSNETTTTVERRFVPRPESAAAARRFVADAVRDISVDWNDVMLLTGELVNNAIVHARSSFDVRVTVDDASIWVAVLDHAPEQLLLSRESAAEGGRGLALIDSIAAAWGFERRADSKLAWFQLVTSRPV